MILNNHSSTSLIFKETPMSLPNSFNQAPYKAQQPVEAKETNSNDPTFFKIIPAKERRITILSADGTRVINENKGFLDELAYHMDGPLKLYSNEYVEDYKCLTKSLRYFGQPTAITYQDARSQVTCEKTGSLWAPTVSKVFPFFISKSCSNPKTMVFNIKDMCYIIRDVRNVCEPPVEKVRKELATIISDFKRFTSNENDMMNPICPQKVKIANNYDEFPFSRVIASKDSAIIATARLFLCDSITLSHNVEQIEELLRKLLQFVEVFGEGNTQLSDFEKFEVELSIMKLSNGSQEYHIHTGKNYNTSADQRTKLELSVERTLRDIALHGYFGSNAHPFDLCRGVVMVPSIQNFKLVTSSSEEEEKNCSRSIGQPPPYNQQ